MKRAHDGRDRRSIRLAGFDYTTCGAYFVTICTHARDHLFGDVAEGAMITNQFGRLLPHYWSRTAGDGRLPPPYDFVVMPNHVHGIVWLPRIRPSHQWPNPVGARRPLNRDDVALLSGADLTRWHSALADASPLQRDDAERHPVSGSPPNSLGALVGAFKSMSTRKINHARGTSGLLVWQRGYHQRIVRNERELERICQYILDNPAHWPEDPNNAEAA